jgi:hypothetical protein
MVRLAPGRQGAATNERHTLIGWHADECALSIERAKAYAVLMLHDRARLIHLFAMKDQILGSRSGIA